MKYEVGHVCKVNNTEYYYEIKFGYIRKKSVESKGVGRETWTYDGGYDECGRIIRLKKKQGKSWSLRSKRQNQSRRQSPID